MPNRWVPFLGDFEETSDGVVFKGKMLDFQKGDKVEKQPLIGKCISDHYLGEGAVSTDITFTEVGASTAELIVYHDVKTGSMLTAGLGGDFYFFSIRLWDQTKNQWLPPFAKGGSSLNIRPNITYKVEVSVGGSMIKLTVDGVDVGRAFLPFQPTGSQVGVFCIGSSEIKFSNFVVRQQKPTVFVVMPFTPPYNELYEEVIRPVCESHGLRPHRADETYGPGMVIADIVDRIVASKVVIAEITPNPVNPNVYYEVGFSHAMRKPTILVADKGSTAKLPFDLSPFRVLFYENSIGGKKRVEQELSRHLDAIRVSNGNGVSGES